MFVDADAHVHECEETWDEIPASAAHFIPKTIAFAPEETVEWLRGSGGHAGRNRFWFIDGQLYPRHETNDQKTNTTIETRTLADVSSRLRHMDELGVEVQVIYPSLLLSEVTRRPEAQVALYRSYNRWLARRCAESGDRLRWVAMVPFSDPPEALAEIRFAKESGACGIFKRGVENDRSASDPYFFPAYQLAADLDLPICIHKGFRWAPVSHHLPKIRPPDLNDFNELSAFASLAADEVPARFTGLRFGFIECGSAWLPHLLGGNGLRQPQRTLADLNFFVACDVDEDVPYLLSMVGDDDHFLAYTDYGHGGGVREAHRVLKEREDIGAEAGAKITNDNARTFYGLRSDHSRSEL